MEIFNAITTRRSIKQFSAREVTRDEIRQVIEAATFAPNHRLTQPWRFYVLGPEARAAYGLALGNRKARKIADPELAEAARAKTSGEHRSLPCMIVVAMQLHDDAEIREEDYAAVMMAVQNMNLVAVSLGLGTHMKTGAVMADPAARNAAGVADNERIVAVLNVGEPLEVPAIKPRHGVDAVTVWRD